LNMEKTTLDGINWGSPVAQCPTSSRVFSTPANFDKHRKDGECVYPELVGLSTNEKGIWRKALTEEQQERMKDVWSKS